MNILTDFKYQHKVHLHEVDGANILFFGQLFFIVHNCYEDLLEQYGLPVTDILANGKYIIPVVNTQANYKQPIYLGETLVLSITVKHIGNSSFSLRTDVRNGSNLLKAEVTTTHVTVSTKTNKPTKIPQQILKIFSPK